MKRLLALLLAALLLSMPLSFARAEGEESPAEPPAQDTQSPEATEPPATVTESPAPTAESEPPAPEETEAPQQTPEESAEAEPTPAPSAGEGEGSQETADPNDPGTNGAQGEDPAAPTGNEAVEDPETTENPAAEDPEAPEEEEPSEAAEETSSDHPQWLKSLECWEREYPTIALTGDLREDILTIARSQLGYSADWTYYVEDEGGRHLYTRYGAWDGAMFSDWCDTFVSFCIYYGGNRSYPGESSCYRHMFALKRSGYWREWNSYIPQKGDIVFFSFPAQYPIPSHVGIVEEVLWGNGNEPSRLVTIEGNQNNPDGKTACVRRMVRLLSDVVGYGTYEPGKTYPEGCSYLTDGWQTIDPDSPYFVEYPVEEVLRFLGLQNTQYYAHWFPNGPEPATPEAPAPEPEAPTPEFLPEPKRQRRILKPPIDLK